MENGNVETRGEPWKPNGGRGKGNDVLKDAAVAAGILRKEVDKTL